MKTETRNLSDLKHCYKCATDKTMDQFNRDRKAGDGCQSCCRPCSRKVKVKDYNKKQSLYMERQRFFTAKHPERKKARDMVGTAIRKGLLSRPESCPECGNDDQRIEAHHHNGYSAERALDVVFLCTECHRAADLEMNEQ